MFVWLTMSLSRPFKEDRWALPLSTPLFSRRSMAWCPWLKLRSQALSQAHQHFRFSEMQGTCGGCFAHPSICSAKGTTSTGVRTSLGRTKVSKRTTPTGETNIDMTNEHRQDEQHCQGERTSWRRTKLPGKTNIVKTNKVARTNEYRQDEQHCQDERTSSRRTNIVKTNGHCQDERTSSQLAYTSHVSPTTFESDERGQSKMFLIKWTNAQFYFTVGKI